MHLRIQRIDPTLPMPEYATKGSVGFDLYARFETVVLPGAIALVSSNLIVEVPQGYALIIASRSSTPRKYGFTVPHGIGVIDQDYHGPEDEIKIQVMNFTSQPVVVKRGDRIAQALLVRVDHAELIETNGLNKANRGGFGSTG